MIFYVNLPVAAVLAVAVLKVIPADTQRPRWSGLDLRGALLATTSLGAIVFAITQADGAGWTSAQTHLFGLGASPASPPSQFLSFAPMPRSCGSSVSRIGPSVADSS